MYGYLKGHLEGLHVDWPTGVGGGVVKPDLGTVWLTRISKRTGLAAKYGCRRIALLQIFLSTIFWFVDSV